MKLEKEFLEVSAKLYDHLTVIPDGEERILYIESINNLLDQRGDIIEELKSNKFQYNAENASHKMLFELDKGIHKRLLLVQEAIKLDMKDLQNAKKNELHYIDPYESLRNLDGRYFDGKK